MSAGSAVKEWSSKGLCSQYSMQLAWSHILKDLRRKIRPNRVDSKPLAPISVVLRLDFVGQLSGRMLCNIVHGLHDQAEPYVQHTQKSDAICPESPGTTGLCN